MSDADTLKAAVKKLNARATQAKIDRHELSEDLPVGWERIPEVAARAHDLFAQLATARPHLKALGT